MKDSELLALAAKAAGIDKPDPMGGSVQPDGTIITYLDCEGKTWKTWNPLNDEGDALRLAVGLGLNIIQQHTMRSPDAVAAACGFSGEDYRVTGVDYNGDAMAATRRSIVIAAAKIGSAMP